MMISSGIMMEDMPNVVPAPTRPSGKNGRMDAAVDKLSAMLGQESSHYGPCMDYLSLSEQDLSTPDAELINEGWRRRICEWSYEVADHFGFDRECVPVALSYIDRVLAKTTASTGKAVSKKEFQLVAVTCLFLALKIHGETGADIPDGQRRKLRIDAFVELSRGLFQAETLEKMERSILEDLEWHLNPPTMVCYLANMLDLLPPTLPEPPLYPFDSNCKIFETARYLTELSVCVSKFSFLFKPSVIAYSAILCGIDGLKGVIHVPCDTWMGYLRNVAYVTSLTPSDGDVRLCCSMLKEICPTMFAPTTPPHPAVLAFTRSPSISSNASNDITLGAHGKTSPVSVIDDTPSRRRKRGRDDEI